MAIDIFFIVMVTFGFYFGYTFGLMKVGLMVISLSFAILAAMAFTPMTTNLIVDTFHVESVFLPFASFLVTLLVVLMLARIMTKLIEETADKKRFDKISQVIGGFVMSLVFTILYSVLITFFGQAKVVDLVFNRDALATSQNGEIKLGISGKLIGNLDTIVMKMNSDENFYPFVGKKEEEEGACRLNFGINKIAGGGGQGYIRGQKSGKPQRWNILPNDTVFITSGAEMYLTVDKKMECFCDSTFLIEASNDTIFFQCMDEHLYSKSRTSFFYKYIELIPKRGAQLMDGAAPFIEEFLDYMSIALERLDKGESYPKKPIDVYSTEEHKHPVQPIIEDEPIEIDSVKEEPLVSDSIYYSIDTSNLPSITPTIDSTSEEDGEEKEEEVEYEG